MKLLSLIAVGLVITLSVGAQVTTDEKQQASPAQQEKAKTEENVRGNEGREAPKSVQPKESERARTSAQETATTQEGAKVNEKVGAKQREGTRVQEKSGSVSRSTTVSMPAESRLPTTRCNPLRHATTDTRSPRPGSAAVAT